MHMSCVSGNWCRHLDTAVMPSCAIQVKEVGTAVSYLLDGTDALTDYLTLHSRFTAFRRS
ncbi:hypothetical protein KIN20_012735 [Parelaphostrongylus tenuis]|uniref:Uncharacterized protein n=1 Tax=Parelaphostrongylus tenuis TaxID=148309 RepID=A0AAD5MEK3_PARTN|nr:hypothetical protein KIN20_012735 [Parelaphostrongylus tenuis]